MNYKITHIIGKLRWKMAMLMVFLLVNGQTVWGQYYRFEYTGIPDCSDPIILGGWSGDFHETTGSCDLPIESSDIVGVTICGKNYGSPTAYGDCWAVS